MANQEFGRVVLTLSVLLGGVHLLGYIFERFRQPRLIGEILAGVLLGPFCLGSLSPTFHHFVFGENSSELTSIRPVLDFIYWLGLLSLMFVSGSETRRLLNKENQKETAWLLGVGTPLPFFTVLFLGLGGWLPLDFLTGEANETTATLLVLAVSVAVTSIPVISRIFYDLKILHTRFASLILGSAVLEDIILWGVLSVATAIAGVRFMPGSIVQNVSSEILNSVIYTGIGLSLAPLLLKKVHHTRWNFFIKTSPVGYVVMILFVYVAVAAILKVNLVFAAFLAGFGLIGGVKGGERGRFTDPLDAVSKFSFAVFIPIYFAMVGYRLVLDREFSFWMLLFFFSGSSALSLISVGLAARFAGFRGLDIVNLAITTNARGGPGIVLASVAYETKIINASFYTTLVMTALLTSQMAGLWLRFVLERGWPLLSKDPSETWKDELKQAS